MTEKGANCLFFFFFPNPNTLRLKNLLPYTRPPFLSQPHIHNNAVHFWSSRTQFGWIEMKAAVAGFQLQSQKRRGRRREGPKAGRRGCRGRGGGENKHTGIVELWVKTAEANQVWFPRCCGGLFEKQKVYDSVLLSRRLPGCGLSLPRNSTKTHAVEYKEEHLEKHKTPGFNMVTKMFHVSLLQMPEKEEEVAAVGE